MLKILLKIQQIKRNKKVYLIIKVIEMVLAVFLVLSYFSQSAHLHSITIFTLAWLLITNMSFFYGTWLEEVEQFKENMLDVKIEQYAHQSNEALKNCFQEIEALKKNINSTTHQAEAKTTPNN